MLSLMPLLLSTLCVGYVFCALEMIKAALDAPIGYEDAGGFHYGIEVPVVAE